MSPLIVDPTPVVIDALVANMINRPTFLPPETDFGAIAAAKIAEHYGFDAAKTTEAARQLAALLKNPDVTSMTPGLRNNTLRTHAAQPAPLAEKGAHAAQWQDVPNPRPSCYAAIRGTASGGREVCVVVGGVTYRPATDGRGNLVFPQSARTSPSP